MRWTQRYGAFALAALAVIGFAPAAIAGAGAAPIEGSEISTGWVRFGHFAPSEQPVDVYVDGATTPAVAGVGFKAVSDYMALSSGPHRFAVKPAAQPDAASILEVEAGVPANGTVTIGAVTTREGVAAQVYDDELTTPPAGESLVRFIHAAPDVVAVDIDVVGGPTLATAIPYPSASPYLPVAAGTYDIQVRSTGSATVLLQIAGWSIDPGMQSSVIIVRGLDGNLDVVPVRDAAQVPAAPLGGVQTGYGGMAPRPSSSMPVWPLAFVPAALVAAFVVVRTARAHHALRLARTSR